MKLWQTAKSDACQLAKGGGLGVYATEDIEYAQELLMVNREYPVTPEEASQADSPHPAQLTPQAYRWMTHSIIDSMRG